MVATYISSPWLLAGNFNALLNYDEKQGGTSHGSSACKLFKGFFDDFCLKDVRF